MMSARMRYGSNRVLERKRPPSTRAKFDDVNVTYTLGRDYDRELDLRRQFVDETLTELSDFSKSINCRHGDDILRCMALYFSYFYGVERVVTVRTVTSSFGVDLNVSERELRIACDAPALSNAFFASEAIREDRVVVNESDLPTSLSYESRRDARVYTLLALYATVEATIVERLRAISSELTLAEMIFATDEEIRGRCDDVAITFRKRSFPKTTSPPPLSRVDENDDDESFLP